jgi:hypothetical protein
LNDTEVGSTRCLREYRHPSTQSQYLAARRLQRFTKPKVVTKFSGVLSDENIEARVTELAVHTVEGFGQSGAAKWFADHNFDDFRFTREPEQR